MKLIHKAYHPVTLALIDCPFGRRRGELVVMVKLGKMMADFSKYACKVTLLKGW